MKEQTSGEMEFITFDGIISEELMNTFAMFSYKRQRQPTFTKESIMLVNISQQRLQITTSRVHCGLIFQV
jgi:hypothetical protein